MKDNREVAAEALRRAQMLIKDRRERRSALFLAGAAGVSLALIVTIALLVPKGQDMPQNTTMTSHTLGALFVSSGVLSYIVVGVLAFILGVCVALLGRWLHDREGKGRF